MKVKDMLRDLGPTTLVQIYKPVITECKYDTVFYKAYSVSAIMDPKNAVWIDKYMDKEIDRAEFEHHYTTEDMVASCNIYLKADLEKTNLMSTYGVFAIEKPITIDYTDLKGKWDAYREQMRIHDDFKIQAWMISAFLNALSEGTLNVMEDKDLS